MRIVKSGDRTHRRFCALAAAVAAGVVLAGCASGQPAAPAADPGTRQRIVPLVDHHQHLMSDRAKSQARDPVPLIELPPELAGVLEARNRVVETRDPGDLFSSDAMILEPVNGEWMQGAEGIEEISTLYTPETRFFANGYTLGADAATITGVIRSGDYESDELHYSMGLERNADGAWRIASEAASLLPARPFAEEITADRLIGNLDDVGIERAVVLSVAYWFGEGDGPVAVEEHENTRAENDWTAAQVARYPDRLVAFCGIAPLRDYAEDEMRRCADELGMPGIKMHFRSADVNLHDSVHVARVRRVFELANELGMAIVVHAETDPGFGTYDRDEAEIFLSQLLPAAPDVVVQIAHLWGGNEVAGEALAVYADAVASGDPRASNLYFDLAEVANSAGGDEEKLALIARHARQIGMDRLLYGSDATASPDLPPSTLGWGMLRRSLPLTDAEFADIADNIAPYLR